jgi:hypothetical protein
LRASVRFSLLSLDEQAAAGMVDKATSVQLMSRYWLITDGAGRSEEVRPCLCLLCR